MDPKSEDLINTSFTHLNRFLSSEKISDIPAFSLSRALTALSILSDLSEKKVGGSDRDWLQHFLEQLPDTCIQSDQYLDSLGEALQQGQLSSAQDKLNGRSSKSPHWGRIMQYLVDWKNRSILGGYRANDGDTPEEAASNSLNDLKEISDLTRNLFLCALLRKHDRKKLFQIFNVTVCLNESCQIIQRQIAVGETKASWSMGEAQSIDILEIRSIPLSDTFRSVLSHLALQIEKDQEISFEDIDAITGSLGALARLNRKYSTELDRFKKKLEELRKDPEALQDYRVLCPNLGIELPDDLSGLISLISRSRRLRDYPR